MSQMTNQPTGAPVKKKGPHPNHSKSPQEKQAKALAKKKRREARLAEKKAAEEAAAKAAPDDTTRNGDPPAEAVTQDPPETQTTMELVNDNSENDTAAEVEAGGTTAETPADNDGENTAAAEPSEEPAKEVTPPRLNRQQRRALEWQAKTKAAAEKRAAAKAAEEAKLVHECATADVPNVPENEPAPVEETTAEMPKVDISGAGEDPDCNPGKELVEAGSFKAMDAAEKSAEEPVVETPVEEKSDESVVEETGTEQSEPETTPEAAPDALEEDTPATEPTEQPAVEATPAVEPAKPALVVDNPPAMTTAAVAAMTDAARLFYGSAFTAARSSLLTEAYRFLMMAVRAEIDGRSTVEMALKQALKKEAEAFATSLAKAA